jgi:GntR family transcriptional repressor for pyruvate dehydrogenase complex
MPIPTDQYALDKAGTASTALYVQIVAQLRKWTREGYLREGELLPSERELANLFDVSRVPVREALKIMEFLGIIQHVRGQGMVVKVVNLNDVLNNIDFLVVDPVSSLRDLFEVREGMEVQAAGLAALRRTDEDLHKLQAALQETELRLAMNLDINDASLQFHTALFAASHNIVSARVNEFLYGMLHYSRMQTLSDTESRQASLMEHKNIFAKIKEQDCEGARAAALDHLHRLEAILKRKYKQ